jgi:hypothetical protein
MNPDLETRVATIERSMRRWRTAAALSLCCAIAAIAWGAGKDEPAVSAEVRTRKLVIENIQGHPVALIRGTDEGATFILEDKKLGTGTLIAEVSVEGAAVAVYGPEGEKAMAGMNMDRRGGFFTATDPKGKTTFEVPRR